MTGIDKYFMGGSNVGNRGGLGTSNLRNLDAMLAAGEITQAEYDRLVKVREKALKENKA